MQRLWETYLNQVLKLENITQLVIYTDSYRFWLASGLLDLADELDLQVNLQIIEEITDEEGMEIKQSLAYLPKSTLLAAFFSNRNPVIEELNTIFPLLTPPLGFSGYSLRIHQHLPDQFYPDHLQVSIHEAMELEQEYREVLQGTISPIEISCDAGSYVTAELISVASYPYYAKSNHILLPGSELILDLDPESVDGVVIATISIGSYSEAGELIDPFGRIPDKVELLIEKGQITDIRGDGGLIGRIHKIIDLPHSSTTLQLSIGLAGNLRATGFIEHDRLMRNVGTISWIGSNETYLEFVIGEIFIDIENR